MSKKTTGTDIGYRAYFAAFAVMLVIVIAAICILSGCLDSIIFKAETPSTDTNDTNAIDTVGDTEQLPEAGDTVISDEGTSEQTDEIGPADSESDTEETEDAETTKIPETEDETEKDETTPPVTTEEVTTEDVTTEEITTEEATTEDVSTEEITTEEIDRSEVFTEQDNHLLYNYEDDGLVITGYDGNPTMLTVAKELDGVEVISVGKNALSGIGTLVEVKISAGVKNIESGAFADCAVLKDVYIPTTVKDIATNAFDGSDNVVIHCAKGSYAEHFASDNGIEYTND